MPTALLPWLMRMGPMAGRLGFRGTGWGKKAQGVPGTAGVLGKGTRPVPGKRPKGVSRRTRDVPESEIGMRVESGAHPIGGAATASQRGGPPGMMRRHPYLTGAAAAGGAVMGYPLVRGGEEAPVQGVGRAVATGEPWSAPEGMASFAEAEIARAEQGEKDFRKLLDYGFLMAATGGDTDKFFERGKWLLEQSDKYAEDKQYAKAVRAVYKKGDMPKNAREAYERLVGLVGPEKAAVLSGHQLGMEEGKTKEERIWNKIMEIAELGDLETAAAELVAAWGTGRLKDAPVNPDPEVRMDRAREIIGNLVSGGGGFAEGITNLRESSA
jgi:hypothetical protein